MQCEYDVIVAGGGISGLCSAYYLLTTQPSYKILLLEADVQLGGRTKTFRFDDGSYVDIGAMWLKKTQMNVLQLVHDLGIQLMDQHETGTRVSIGSNGTRNEYEESSSNISLVSLLEIHYKLINSIDILFRKKPLQTSGNKEEPPVETMTVEQWKVENFSTVTTKETLDRCIQLFYECEPSELSFTNFLQNINAAGGFLKLASSRFNTPDMRIIGGIQTLIDALQAKIEQLGGKIILNSPIQSVEYKDSHVLVKTNCSVFSTQTTIITIPPKKALRIDFLPELPKTKKRYLEEVYIGCYIKCVVYYKVAFWRENGFSGNGYFSSMNETVPEAVIFDYTDHEGKFPALVFFIEGNDGDNFRKLDAKEQILVLKNTAAQLFGPNAYEIQKYFIKDWSNDQWTGGCPVDLIPEASKKYFDNTPAEQVGERIFWGGTESSTEWKGFIEGAICAAKRSCTQSNHFLSKCKTT